MTDERMTQGDVRLREEEREEIARLFGYVPEPEPLEQMLEAVERIVAARVGEVVERVEVAAEHLEAQGFYYGALVIRDTLRRTQP